MPPRSIFAEILAEVVEALPGARGAVFVDWEGETVDSYAHMGTGDIQLVGAHWAIIHNQCRSASEKLGLGAPAEVWLRFRKQHVLLRRITDEYLAVVTMSPEANLGRALDLMRRAEARLREEM